MSRHNIRDSRFELLRLIAMLLIMFQHSLERSFANWWGVLEAPFSFNYVVSIALGIWGQLGVMLFVMVSSWFLADRQGISGKKVLMLLLQVSSTCIGLVVGFAIFKPDAINLRLLVKEIATPIYKQYWFITTFLAFFISAPLLQKLVHVLDDHMLRNACIILTVLIPVYNYLFTNVGDTWADFCYIFFVTAYLKRNPDNWFKRHRYLFILGMVFIVGLIISYKVFLESKFGTGNLKCIFAVLRGRTLLCFLITVCLFYCFESMKPFYSKILNTMAGSAFGIYLLHENLLVRGEQSGNSWLWNDLLHIDEKLISSNLFVLYWIVSILVVFTLCIIIDLIRKNTIERLYGSNRLVDKVADKFYGKILH